MGPGFKVQWEGSFRFWQNTFCMEKGGFSGIILVLPILLTRFVMLAFPGKEVFKRAAFFPQQKESKK